MTIKEFDFNHELFGEVKESFKEFLAFSETNTEGMKVLKLFNNNNELVTIAVVDQPNEENYKSLVEEYLGYDDEETVNEYYSMIQNKVYLTGIKSLITGQNGSDKILEYVKTKYNGFWFECARGTEDFWSTKGFEDIGNYMYMN